MSGRPRRAEPVAAITLASMKQRGWKQKEAILLESVPTDTLPPERSSETSSNISTHRGLNVQMPELVFVRTTVCGTLVSLVETRAAERAIPLGDAGLAGPRLRQGHLQVHNIPI